MARERAGVAEIFRRAGGAYRERMAGRLDAGRLRVIEGAGAVVQRIHHDGIDADHVARANHPMDRIKQQDLRSSR